MQPLVSFERREETAEVLVVTNFWPHPTNPMYGIFVKRQVESLTERGISCDVLFVRGFAAKRAYLSAAARLLAANVRGRRYRLVHAHGGEAAIVARCYLRSPLLVTYYGSDLLGIRRSAGSLPLASRLRRYLIRQSARTAKATITQSEEMARCLPRVALVRNRVIPNGIDRDLFRLADRSQARRKLGWNENESVVLFAGNPELPVKRYWLAEAACHRAADLIGSLRLEAASGIPPERMPLVLNASDCLLLTSLAEGSPNIVKEAVMCGLPVVTTRVGDVEDLLRDVEPSWICESDPMQLGQALAACLSQRVRSNESAIASELSLQAVAARIECLYTDLAPELSPRERINKS